MINREIFIQALNSNNPVESLRSAVAVSLEKGSTIEQVNKELNNLFDYFRSQNDEDKENVVADVLDYVVGWCSPQSALQTILKPGQSYPVWSPYDADEAADLMQKALQTSQVKDQE
jgi:hypothetical protein